MTLEEMITEAYAWAARMKANPRKGHGGSRPRKELAALTQRALAELKAGGHPKQVAASTGLSYLFVVKLARGEIYIAKSKRAGA
jgi:hypothetical protein